MSSGQPPQQQQQAKKIAWLESMLDTSIVAYESHRNALENIYAQLAQWQQPPNTGCIHITPTEVNELLRDINDVLDQCALQLQPFGGENNNNNDNAADAPADTQENSQRPPSSQARNGPVNRARPQEPDSHASSHRGVTHTPSLRSPVQPEQDHPLQPEQEQQQQQNDALSKRTSPPPSAQLAREASRTPSVQSRVSQPRSAAAVKAGPHAASARTSSDAPSRATNKSGTKPPQERQQRQPKASPPSTTPSATPSRVSSVPPNVSHMEGRDRSERAEENNNNNNNIDGDAGQENLDDTVPTHADVLMSDVHSVQSHHRLRSDDRDDPFTESALDGQESASFAPEDEEHASQYEREASAHSSSVQDRQNRHERNYSSVSGGEAPSHTAQSGQRPQGPASQRGVPDVHPAQLDKTGQRAPHQQQQQQPLQQQQGSESGSTRSGPSQASSARRAYPQPLQHSEDPRALSHVSSRVQPPSGTSSATRNGAVGVVQQQQPPPRPRMQACPHHKQRAGLAMTPWPILNNGRDDAAAIGGPQTPTAAARAAATRDELPAEQYSAFKERGETLKSSPERRAAASALERRAAEVAAAKEAATYLAPDDAVAERAAAQARARQPEPSSQPGPAAPASTASHPHSRTTSGRLEASQRSRHAAPAEQQQQQQHEPRHSQSHSQSQFEQSFSAAGEEGEETDRRSDRHYPQHHTARVRGEVQEAPREEQSHPDGEVGNEEEEGRDSALIPRRRGSSAAVETESEVSSVYPRYVGDGKSKPSEYSQRSASQFSRRSQPPLHPQEGQEHAQKQQQQQQPSTHTHSNYKSGSRTPSQVGSAFRSASANENGAPQADLMTSTPHQHTLQHQQQHQQQPPTVASSSRASSANGVRSGSANAAAAPPVKRQLNTDAVQQQPQSQQQQQQQQPNSMDASHAGSVGLVYTPSATPQRDSTRDFNAAAAAAAHAAAAAGMTSTAPAASNVSAPQQQQQQSEGDRNADGASETSSAYRARHQEPGTHRPLRTAVPRRTTPRAYDSTQSEDAIFHGRLRGSPGRPPVRTDSPNALRYMDREDSQLRQRKEEELAEIHKDPRLQQQQQLIAGPNGMLKITDGSADGATGNGGAMTVPGKSGRQEKPKLTAVEEQLLAERAVLHTQLEKMQMEVTIATSRNKEWGNERRYSQLNARMTRVMADLDRVEKELRTVRNFDREASSQSASKAR